MPLEMTTYLSIDTALAEKVIEGTKVLAKSRPNTGQGIHALAQIHCYQQARMFLDSEARDDEIRAVVQSDLNYINRMHTILYNGLQRTQAGHPIVAAPDYAYVQSCMMHYGDIVRHLQHYLDQVQTASE